jgi:hypothetical protein
MNSTKKALLVTSILAAVAIIGTAIVLSVKSPLSNGTDNSKTALGGLFERANQVSQLKKRMGELRDVYPAMVKFAQEHQDDLPRTVAELRPYLPARLADLNDGQWEIPATGKMAVLLQPERAAGNVLLQQKNVAANTARIVVFADGHLEYTARAH